jgi:hypothetical protein
MCELVELARGRDHQPRPPHAPPSQRPTVPYPTRYPSRMREPDHFRAIWRESRTRFGVGGFGCASLPQCLHRAKLTPFPGQRRSYRIWCGHVKDRGRAIFWRVSRGQT